MLKCIGAILVLAISVILSEKLCSIHENKIVITSSLIEFTEKIRSSIYTSRLPLDEIFADFTDPKLKECGFIFQLKKNGLKEAISSIADHITDRSRTALENFASNLGGINTETQLKLCEEISKVLQEEHSKQKEHFAEKRKMYKTLPILFAMSIIIIMI